MKAIAMSKTKLIKNTTFLFVYLFLVWGMFRLIFKLPDEVEEIVIKPIVWVIPVLYLLRKEKESISSIGITFSKLFPSIYLSLALGSLFVFLGFITNFIKYGYFNFNANIGTEPLIFGLILSFLTAISEELVFRGFIFSRLWQVLNNEWKANLLTSVLWTIIHIPVTLFVNKLDPVSAIVYLFLTFIFGFGASYLYARTKNIISPILLHVLWQWPIILFR